MTDLFDTYPDAPGYKNETTSKEAAEAMEGAAKTLRIRALAMITAAGWRGYTAHELAVAMNVDRTAVQPRTSELKVAGKIVDSGRRRPNPNGKRAIVWTLPRFKEQEA